MFHSTYLKKCDKLANEVVNLIISEEEGNVSKAKKKYKKLSTIRFGSEEEWDHFMNSFVLEKLFHDERFSTAIHPNVSTYLNFMDNPYYNETTPGYHYRNCLHAAIWQSKEVLESFLENMWKDPRAKDFILNACCKYATDYDSFETFMSYGVDVKGKEVELLSWSHGGFRRLTDDQILEILAYDVAVRDSQLDWFKHSINLAPKVMDALSKQNMKFKTQKEIIETVGKDYTRFKDIPLAYFNDQKFIRNDCFNAVKQHFIDIAQTADRITPGMKEDTNRALEYCKRIIMKNNLLVKKAKANTPKTPNRKKTASEIENDQNDKAKKDHIRNIRNFYKG